MGTARSWGRTITEADLLQYCMLTQDWADIHTNHDFVARTVFKRPIAHAGLTLAIASGLSSSMHEGVVPAGVESVRFRRPAYVGDTVYALLGRPRQGGPKVDWVVVNQSDEVLVSAEVSMVDAALSDVRAPQSTAAAASDRDGSGTDGGSAPGRTSRTGEDGEGDSELYVGPAGQFLEDLEVGQRRSTIWGQPVHERDVETYLAFSADPLNAWGSLFGVQPSPVAAGRAPEDGTGVVPGLFILGMQWGAGGRRGELTGIVATYLLEDLHQVAQLPVDTGFSVDAEVISVEDFGNGYGNVRTRREVRAGRGALVLSFVEKARWRTRAKWKDEQAGN